MVHVEGTLYTQHALPVCSAIFSLNIPSPPCRDSRDPTLYRVGDYDKNKQWLKGKPKPITDELTTSTSGGRSVSPGGSAASPGDKRIATISGRSSMLEASQVHDMIQGAVSGVVGNFVGITRAVRQRILPDKQLLEVGHGSAVCSKSIILQHLNTLP